MKKTALWALAALLFASCGQKSQNIGEAGNDYAVVTLQPKDVELNTAYPATIKGMQDIEIRPKVSGYRTLSAACGYVLSKRSKSAVSAGLGSTRTKISQILKSNSKAPTASAGAQA